MKTLGLEEREMPFQKGRVKTGGRKKGVPSRKDAQGFIDRRVGQALAQLASQAEISEAYARMATMTPLEVLLTGMQLKLGRGDIDGAAKIAEAAVPYTSPKLAMSEVRVKTSTDRSDSEIAAEITALRAKLEAARPLPAPAIIEAVVEPTSMVSYGTVTLDDDQNSPTTATDSSVR